MTTTLSPSAPPVRSLTPVIDCLAEDEDYTDPFCTCPDGMPCWCVAESVDPIENIYD